MASRIWKRIRGLVQNQIMITGSFGPNGTGAPTVTAGKGFTVTRTGIGLYRITFTESYIDVVSATATLQNSDTRFSAVQIGAYNTAGSFLNVRTFDNVGGSSSSTGRAMLPLNLTHARELTANDTDVLANHGGILANNSSPFLRAVSPGSNQTLRAIWAAGNTDKITWSVPVPADLDSNEDIFVTLLTQMGGSTDTPDLDVEAYFATVGTDVGGDTPPLSNTFQESTVTIANANVQAHPDVITIAVAPQAHATDTVNVTGAYIEYVRRSDVTTQMQLADLSADTNNQVNFAVCFRNSTVN